VVFRVGYECVKRLVRSPINRNAKRSLLMQLGVNGLDRGFIW